MSTEPLTMTTAWDKVLPRSQAVDHEKVAFHNRFGITLAADLYRPRVATGPLAAIAVSDPFGAVKEQSSGLYAQTMAERGFHERSGNSTDGWNTTSNLSWMNTNILQFASEIGSAVMVLHGEKAHSRYMGEDAFSLLTGDNKELVIVPGASHVDLYDGGASGAIPFDRIEGFFRKYLVRGAVRGGLPPSRAG